MRITNGRESNANPHERERGQILFKQETYDIIGAAFEVYNELGCGFLESVYQEALQREMMLKGIPFNAQMPITLYYKNEPLQKQFIADMVCHESIIVELKAIPQITIREESQLLNYLKATGLRLGLLINFGNEKKLPWKRMIL